MNQSINQSINPLVDHAIIQSVDQCTVSLIQVSVHSFIQSINQSINQSTIGERLTFFTILWKKETFSFFFRKSRYFGEQYRGLFKSEFFRRWAPQTADPAEQQWITRESSLWTAVSRGIVPHPPSVHWNRPSTPSSSIIYRFVVLRSHHLKKTHNNSGEMNHAFIIDLHATDAGKTILPNAGAQSHIRQSSHHPGLSRFLGCISNPGTRGINGKNLDNKSELDHFLFFLIIFLKFFSHCIFLMDYYS